MVIYKNVIINTLILIIKVIVERGEYTSHLLYFLQNSPPSMLTEVT